MSAFVKWKLLTDYKFKLQLIFRVFVSLHIMVEIQTTGTQVLTLKAIGTRKESKICFWGFTEKLCHLRQWNMDCEGWQTKTTQKDKIYIWQNIVWWSRQRHEETVLKDFITDIFKQIKIIQGEIWMVLNIQVTSHDKANNPRQFYALGSFWQNQHHCIDVDVTHW